MGAGIEQSVQRLATGWMAEGSEFESRYGQEFSLLHSVQSVLAPTQRPIQWVLGLSGRGVKLTSHLNLVPKSRICGSIHPFTHTPSWLSA
jgi:hypothetical protein